MLKQIWSERDKYEGKGVVIIPSDPNALLDRLDLLMASKGAGNTGLRNEIVSICDELKRQQILNVNADSKESTYMAGQDYFTVLRGYLLVESLNN